MTSFLANLESFEAACTSQRQLALLRMHLLEHDRVGFAALFVPLLKNAVDSWLMALNTCSNTAIYHDGCEEKKQEDVYGEHEPLISKLEETDMLSRVLQVHVAVSRLDPTLAQEVGCQGSHAILSRLIRYDGFVWQTEENQDSIMELQDACCEIAALTGGSFPLKVSPCSIDELKARLPLCFDIHAVENTDSEPQNCRQVLIHQVTERQSAQEDVGFVMWPSAVALSRWLVSNPQVVKGRTVLELGAGCGLTGLVAATLSPSHVILSDFNPKVLENLERNIVLNNASSTRAIGLDFYQQSGQSTIRSWIDVNGNNCPAVDVVLAADMICQPDDAVAAAKTIHDALLPNGVAIVICADAKHRFGVDCFERECQKVGLKVQVSNVAELYEGDEMEMTTGYCEGMTLTLFQIEHASER